MSKPQNIEYIYIPALSVVRPEAPVLEMLSTLPDTAGYSAANRLAWNNVLSVYNRNFNRVTSYTEQLSLALDGAMEYISYLSTLLGKR